MRTREQQNKRANADFALGFLLEYSELKLQECTMLESHTWREVHKWLKLTNDKFQYNSERGRRQMKKYWEEKKNETF